MVDNALARIKEWWTKRIVMPRWAILVDGVYRLALLAGAVIVAILWWQAATRDEEADRNARIQSCASVYAATYSAWDADAGRLFGELVAASNEARESGEDPVVDPETLAAYTTAVDNAAELAKLRIGLGIYSAASVKAGNEFECPVLSDHLMVTPVYPPGFAPGTD